MKIGLLTVGTEILLGDTVNTNLSKLGSILYNSGFYLNKEITVSDERSEIEEGFKYLYESCEVIIICGGLGPTEDDITKESISEILDIKLVLDKNHVAWMENRWKSRGLKMPETNIKQAMIPENAKKLINHNGTAPGLHMRDKDKNVIILPGPPNEFIPLVNEELIPFLQNEYDIKNKQLYSEDYINNITIEIHKNFNTNLGILGASGGQFIDTCPINSFIDKEEYIKDYKNVDDILNLIHLKTTTFFEISFVSAYLLAGGNINNIEKIKKCVKYFGLAFQISDDFEDIIEDSKRIVNKEFNPNLICKYGKKKAMDIFNKSITQFINLSKELKIYNKVFIELIEFLNRRITKSLV